MRRRRDFVSQDGKEWSWTETLFGSTKRLEFLFGLRLFRVLLVWNSFLLIRLICKRRLFAAWKSRYARELGMKCGMLVPEKG